MKVTISVKGRFHAFFLANELQKAGLLNQLITSYPRFKAKEYGVNGNLMTSLVTNELAERALRHPIFRLLKLNNTDHFFRELFDRRAAKNIDIHSDIIVGWSGGCLHTMHRLQQHPAKMIVENGSTHAVFQKNIVEEEFGLHGLKYYANPSTIQKQLEEYELANYISTPSQFTKKSFLKFGIPEHKIIQVPYGVDTKTFYPSPKPDKKFRLIFCGNVGLRKGIQYLLKAFYELKLPNTELYIIGPAGSELKPFIEKYKADNIIWAGAFNENTLAHEYAKGSVFCLPSIEEGLALVIPQAMACGLPVICTTNSGGEEIIRDGKEGFILPIRQIDALKEKILLLYENEELRKTMGDQAYKTITSQFTWAHYGEKMIVEYGRIIG